jgi:hypothetical protein
VPTGWKIVVPMSPAAFASEASSSPTDGPGRYSSGAIGRERRLPHQAPRDADGVGGDLPVLVGCQIVRRDDRRPSDRPSAAGSVPREVGRRLQALTVTAGKRCSGSPNLSSDSGWTWNWMLARSCPDRAGEDAELRGRHGQRAAPAQEIFEPISRAEQRMIGLVQRLHAVETL